MTLGVSDSFVLIDDFLNCGNIQFFCYTMDSSLHYTLQSSDHSILISSSLHGSSKSVPIPTGRSIFLKGLNRKLTLFQDQIHQMISRNSTLQALLSSCGAIDSFLQPLSDSNGQPSKKQRVSEQASITSYCHSRIGNSIVIRICGRLDGFKGNEVIVSVASSLISLLQYCDHCELNSKGYFSAEIRLRGSFSLVSIPLFVFVSNSQCLQYAGVINLHSHSSILDNYPYPRLLYDEVVTVSVREFFASYGLLNERFLSSTTRAITLPLTREEAEEIVKLCPSYVNQTKYCLDVSEIPTYRQVVIRLRESLLKEVLFCKDQLVVSLYRVNSSLVF